MNKIQQKCALYCYTERFGNKCNVLSLLPKPQPNLEFLDASYNHLVTLHGLKALGQLKQLDVRWNNLTKAREDTAVLRKHTPALLKFDTRYNPWNRVGGAIKKIQLAVGEQHIEEEAYSEVVFPFQPKTVRMTILGRLTTLTHLDDVVVAEEEAASAVKMAASSKMNQVKISHIQIIDLLCKNK